MLYHSTSQPAFVLLVSSARISSVKLATSPDRLVIVLTTSKHEVGNCKGRYRKGYYPITLVIHAHLQTRALALHDTTAAFHHCVVPRQPGRTPLCWGSAQYPINAVCDGDEDRNMMGNPVQMKTFVTIAYDLSEQSEGPMSVIPGPTVQWMPASR